jgi:ATP-dependent Clp protease adaptor protein ClpS
MIAPVTAPPVPEIELGTPPDVETQLDPPYRILIHNDDHTPMDFVTRVLVRVFELSLRHATRVMLTAHLHGIAYVMTLPFEEAKYRVGQAHGIARAAGYPLTFSIEPE